VETGVSFGERPVRKGIPRRSVIKEKPVMKTRSWLMVVAAAAVFGIVGWTGYGQRSPLPQRAPLTNWEYKVLYVPGIRNMSEKVMNDLGAQGWELVTYQAINNEGGTIGAGNYFFKRAKTIQH
jgi:hypothetical protein